MVIQIPQALIAEKNKLANAEHPIWLYEFRISEGDSVYLAANNEDVVDSLGRTWQAYPITLGGHELANDGKITRPQITLPAVNDDFLALIELHHAFDGVAVTRHYVWSNHLDQEPIEQFTDYIIEADISLDARLVTFKLGPPELYDEEFPRNRMARTCGRAYRSDECGFPKEGEEPAGVMSQPGVSYCDFTLDGPDGCERKGEAYIAAGHAELSRWPGNHFAFLTIPSRRGP